MKIIAFITVILIVSCAKKQLTPITPTEEIRYLNTVHVSARVRELVNSDRVIDLDPARVDSPSANLSNEDYAEIKAAVYRFYKNVKLEDGKYIYHGSTIASKVKLSDRLLTAFIKNLNDSNRSLSRMKAKGQQVNMPPIDDEYLNSLLN